MAATPQNTSRRVLRLPEVVAATGFCRAWIYHLAACGNFPKPRKIGQRAVGWDSFEVEAWIATRLDRPEGRV